jgi:uncharacterized protein with LGFP repeats
MMKKIILAALFFANVTQSIAQPPPIRQKGNTDPLFAEAKKSNELKMKEVLAIANGFKDLNPVKVKSKYDTDGYYQATNGGDGYIFYIAKLKTSVFSYGVIRKKHVELGLEQGVLGFPTADSKTVKSGFSKATVVYAPFENGAICFKPGMQPIAILPAAIWKYNNMNGPQSDLGYPTSEYTSFLGRDNQYFQNFENGAFWGDKDKAYSMHGAIWKKFNVAKHGMPVEDEKGNSVMHAATLKCAKGTIVWGEKSGAWFIQEPFLAEWYKLGSVAPDSKTGMPTSDPSVGDAMTAQNFEKGLMLLVSGKVTFVPDDSEKNKADNNKIRQTIRIPGKQ